MLPRGYVPVACGSRWCGGGFFERNIKPRLSRSGVLCASCEFDTQFVMLLTTSFLQRISLLDIVKLRNVICNYSNQRDVNSSTKHQLLLMKIFAPVIYEITCFDFFTQFYTTVVTHLFITEYCTTNRIRRK